MLDTRANRSRDLLLVTIGDDRYAMPLAVVLSSALKHLGPGWNPRLFILADGISEKNKARIAKVVQSAWPGVRLEYRSPGTASIDDVPISTWHTRSVLMKLFAPHEMPPGADRMLVIDGDAVVTGDLAGPFSQPFEGHALLAVENYVRPTLSASMPRYCADLNLPPDGGYFNAGMFVVDVPRWKAERITERALDYLSTYKFDFLEQDALNAVLAGGWTPLHPRWNLQLAFLDQLRADQRPCDDVHSFRAELFRHPGVVHYVGPRKPWHWRYKGGKGEAFFRALRQSGWYPEPFGIAWVMSRRASHFVYRIMATLKAGTRRLRGAS